MKFQLEREYKRRVSTQPSEGKIRIGIVEDRSIFDLAEWVDTISDAKAILAWEV